MMARGRRSRYISLPEWEQRMRREQTHVAGTCPECQMLMELRGGTDGLMWVCPACGTTRRIT